MLYEVITDTEDNSGKIVEQDASGKEVRPWDISITRNVFTLFFSGIILIVLILYVAGSYKKNGFNVKNKLVCFMEMFIVMMNDDVIKPCVGKDYKKYAPYFVITSYSIHYTKLYEYHLSSNHKPEVMVLYLFLYIQLHYH